jgi:hypothetical protein
VLVGRRDVLEKAGADPAWPRLEADAAAVAPVSVVEVRSRGALVEPPPSAAGPRRSMRSISR